MFQWSYPLTTTTNHNTSFVHRPQYISQTIWCTDQNYSSHKFQSLKAAQYFSEVAKQWNRQHGSKVRATNTRGKQPATKPSSTIPRTKHLTKEGHGFLWCLFYFFDLLSLFCPCHFDSFFKVSIAIFYSFFMALNSCLRSSFDFFSISRSARSCCTCA